MMTEVALLIAELKRQLKNQGLTYRDVAAGLHISEPSVKRLFASQRLTVARLSQICGLLGMTLAELLQQAHSGTPELKTLTTAQEAQLVADNTLLLVAVCALNQWTLQEIVSVYAINELACLQYLLQLDRLGLIRLMPGNRIRLAVSRDFDWLPNGPISQYFRQQCQNDFLDAPFTASGENHLFLQGMLTRSARAEIVQELARLRRKFAQLHQESMALPLGQRHGTGMMLAMRDWEPKVFSGLRRENTRLC